MQVGGITGALVAGVALAFASASGAALTAAPGAAADTSSPAALPPRPPSFDHAAWARLLATYVDDAGRVAYKRLAAEDRATLRHYLDGVARAQPDDWPRDEQIAFWLNAYNAGIVSAVLAGESPETVTPRAHLFKSWKIEVAGAARTPDEIEHAILRKRFEEPRIHFALVCAAAGCPPLRRHAYTADSLSLQLDDQARRFIGDSSRNRIDPSAKRLELSPIFDWFRADFERASGTVPLYLARYVRDEAARQWLSSGSTRPKFLDYDWSLNHQPMQRPERRRALSSR
jgi:hypothetical protein